jgi:hypothetical protein
VALLSDGGSLFAGIRIGAMIRTKKFTTVVPDGARCASACAVAWLGGARRVLGKEARVGFHAAYILKAGGPAESGPGNAILGAYLSQLGLSEKAILFITQEAPSSIHWMSLAEADEHGITVAALPSAVDVGAAEHSDGKGYPPEGTKERQAVDFVRSVTALWSGPNVDVLLALRELYTDDVRYYGKSISQEVVLARKRRFAGRWPQRSLSIRPGSLAASCGDTANVAKSCHVSGIMDWEYRNAGTKESSRGVSSFEYTVVVDGVTPRIAAEKASVDKQQPASKTQPGRLAQLFAQIAKLRPISAVVSPLRPKAAIRKR